MGAGVNGEDVPPMASVGGFVTVVGLEEGASLLVGDTTGPFVGEFVKVGCRVGAIVGLIGAFDGLLVDGMAVSKVGESDGMKEGGGVGIFVGLDQGCGEGIAVGPKEGPRDGIDVGAFVGLAVRVPFTGQV